MSLLLDVTFDTACHILPSLPLVLLFDVLDKESQGVVAPLPVNVQYISSFGYVFS